MCIFFFSSDMSVCILYIYISQHFYFLPKQILNHFSTHFCESGVAKKNPIASKRFLYFKQLMEHFDFDTKLKYLGIKSCIYCKIQKYVCIVLLDEFIKKIFMVYLRVLNIYTVFSYSDINKNSYYYTVQLEPLMIEEQLFMKQAVRNELE